MLIPEGLKSTNTPAGSASIARLNRSAVPLSVSPATGDCVTCNATSGSDADVTSSRADPGPVTTRRAGQSAGTVSATRPSTRNVVGALCTVAGGDTPRRPAGATAETASGDTVSMTAAPANPLFIRARDRAPPAARATTRGSDFSPGTG